MRRFIMPDIRKNRITAAIAVIVRTRYSVVFDVEVLTESHRSFMVCVAPTPSSANDSLRASVSSSG